MLFQNYIYGFKPSHKSIPISCYCKLVLFIINLVCLTEIGPLWIVCRKSDILSRACYSISATKRGYFH